jgi:toxin YoeB
VNYRLYFTKEAQKDAKKVAAAGLKPQAVRLLNLLKHNPFARYPPYEKLIGDLSGAYSRRISLHHRLVYQVLEEERAVKILRMWTHYGE